MVQIFQDAFWQRRWQKSLLPHHQLPKAQVPPHQMNQDWHSEHQKNVQYAIIYLTRVFLKLILRSMFRIILMKRRMIAMKILLKDQGEYFTYIHQHQIQVSVLIWWYLNMLFWFRYLCHNQGKGLILFWKIPFLQKRWIQVKILEHYCIFLGWIMQKYLEVGKSGLLFVLQWQILWRKKMADRSCELVSRSSKEEWKWKCWICICSTSVYLSLWRIWREVEISLWLWSRVEI